MIPKINDVPKYEIEVPSTGQKLRFRPYLVKEEKVLLTAFESKDEGEGFKAIFNTLNACVENLPSGNDLTVYDVLYLFAKIRGKSVGEVAELNVPCKSCGFKNQVEVDIEGVGMTEGEFKNKTIQLDEVFSVEMKYPSYNQTLKVSVGEKNAKDVRIKLVAESIEAILTDENRIETKEEAEEDVIEFVESLSEKQFQSLSDYLDQAPKFQYEFAFKCVDCGEHNEYKITEPNDFF